MFPEDLVKSGSTSPLIFDADLDFFCLGSKINFQKRKNNNNSNPL